ncbi:MAG: N-acetylmuramic acid 6-phosphate etherase [Alphaproteobacteria bacterium]|nr:N-acetylmuramic acid 6-phosphate etherase [Alphaproteobacteria bacterium]
MQNIIITEQSNADTKDIDLMDSLQIARALNNEDKKVALAVESVLEQIAKAIDLIAKSFLSGGRLAYFGAGTSGRLGVLDASECPPTFGVDSSMVQAFVAGGDRALRSAIENAEDNVLLAMEDLKKFNPSTKDVVVGISASGNPKYILAVLQQAKNIGAMTIAITSNPEAKLKVFADVFICTPVGQEAITGSSRLKSGTAQKMVLNMLSTGAMIRIGKTYQNYMIDMRLLNTKLLNRGVRFVSQICNVDNDEALNLLQQAEYSVKTACVMKIKNCNKAQARKLLAENGGILRKVI